MSNGQDVKELRQIYVCEEKDFSNLRFTDELCGCVLAVVFFTLHYLKHDSGDSGEHTYKRNIPIVVWEVSHTVHNT